MPLYVYYFYYGFINQIYVLIKWKYYELFISISIEYLFAFLEHVLLFYDLHNLCISFFDDKIFPPLNFLKCTLIYYFYYYYGFIDQIYVLMSGKYYESLFISMSVEYLFARKEIYTRLYYCLWKLIENFPLLQTSLERRALF